MSLVCFWMCPSIGPVCAVQQEDCSTPKVSLDSEAMVIHCLGICATFLLAITLVIVEICLVHYQFPAIYWYRYLYSCWSFGENRSGVCFWHVQLPLWWWTCCRDVCHFWPCAKCELYNFGCVCLYVCNMITFESLDIGSLYLHIRYISMSSQGQGHRSKNSPKSLFPQRKTSIANNSGSIKYRAVKFACIIVFSAVAARIVWPPSLSRDRKWPHIIKCTHSRVVGLRLEGNLVRKCCGYWCKTPLSNSHCIYNSRGDIESNADISSTPSSSSSSPMSFNGSTLVSTNKINLRRSRLIMGLVTVSGFNSRCWSNPGQLSLAIPS